MADKEFTFVKVETGGRLIVEGKSEKAVRDKLHLDPELWILEGKENPNDAPPEENSPD